PIPQSTNPQIIIFFALGGVAALLAAFGPFLLSASGGLWFALVEYHSGRVPGTPFALLAYKAGFLSRVMRAYLVPLSVGVVLCLREVLVVNTREIGHRGDRRSFASAVWLAVLGISALHLSAPFPYDDYQVIVLPLFAAVLAAAVVRRVWSRGSPGMSGRRSAWLVVSVLLLCGASAFASPRVQGWFVGERHTMWWPLKDEYPLAKLRRAAAIVRPLAGEGDLLLTQDTYLAVESGLRVPPGMELGPFCYFPEWDREKAERLHVLNLDMMLETLRTSGAAIAAFSGYGLAISAPSITQCPADQQRALWKALEERYESSVEIENFGQAETTLRILRQRAP
ncbi:MAG: hypothetical protein HQ559_03435, partial [Lentisphaerae bacterium]|nr:hypothetical protein [Lentisphaerota bacterium]